VHPTSRHRAGSGPRRSRRCWPSLRQTGAASSRVSGTGATRSRTCAAGHFDGQRRAEELWNDEVAVPVAGGWPVIEVDTEGPVDVPDLAQRVRAAALRHGT